MNVKDFARKGAVAANNKRTPEERRKLAIKANKARWKKYREMKKKLNLPTNTKG